MRLVTTCLLAAAACVSIASPAAAQDTATQAGAARLAAREAREPIYNGRDLLFLRHMIMHHEQALVMSDLVPGRSGRPEFHRFARYVKRAQAAEIELMQALLDLAAGRGLEVPEHPPHGDPPMAGMLSSAEMDALAAAEGAEFERLWLEGMIFHHQGALDMSRMQQQNQLDTGRRPYGLAPLIEDILVEQRAEITKMRDWLVEWGLVE